MVIEIIIGGLYAIYVSGGIFYVLYQCRRGSFAEIGDEIREWWNLRENRDSFQEIIYTDPSFNYRKMYD